MQAIAKQNKLIQREWNGKGSNSYTTQQNIQLKHRHTANSTQIRIDEQYYIKRTDKWNEYICMHMHWQWADHDYDCCLWWLCTRFGNTYNKCEYAEQCCPFFRSKWNSIVVHTPKHTHTHTRATHDATATVWRLLFFSFHSDMVSIEMFHRKTMTFYSESVFLPIECGAPYEITWTEYWSSFCSPFNEWMMVFMKFLPEIFSKEGNLKSKIA